MEARGSILLADDEERILRTLGRALREDGHEVVTTADGREARALLADRAFDLIVSNPPYVPDAELAGLAREVRDHEPRVALTSGPTGFEIYERLISGARRTLRPGGRLVLELGYNSSERVVRLLDGGFGDIRLTADLAGIPRVVSCRLLA